MLASHKVSRTTMYDVMNDGESLTHNPSKDECKTSLRAKKVAEKKSFNRHFVEVFYDLHSNSFYTHHGVNIRKSAAQVFKAAEFVRNVKRIKGFLP